MVSYLAVFGRPVRGRVRPSRVCVGNREARTLAIPDFQTVMLPFLEALRDGKERTMRDLTEELTRRFMLTKEERQEHLPSGPQSLFYNRVAWAKTHLKTQG